MRKWRKEQGGLGRGKVPSPTFSWYTQHPGIPPPQGPVKKR